MTHPTDDFRFGYLQSSNIEDYFRSKKDVVFRNMYLFMKRYRSKTNEEGVAKVLNGYVRLFDNFLVYLR